MGAYRPPFNVCITNPLHEDVVQHLSNFATVTTCYGLKPNEIADHIVEQDALIVRSATRVNESLLTAGKHSRLKVVGTATAGVDHIDLGAAERLGIQVVNSTWGNSLANAEYIIGMMITLSRNIWMYHQRMRAGIWDPEYCLGSELAGKTFGTIGFGKIGSITSEKARLLGMRVIAYDPLEATDAFTAKGVKRLNTLEQVMEQADFLSLSLPFYADTWRMICKEQLRLMKPTSYIIQSSRGGIIDEPDLIWALRNNIIAGAAIDVFVTEPMIRKEFLDLENVILTPHIGCSSMESRLRSGMRVAEDVERVLKGEPPIHQVRSVEARDYHRLLG